MPATYLIDSDELNAIVKLRRRDVTAALRTRIEEASGLTPRIAAILDEVEATLASEDFDYNYLGAYLDFVPKAEEPQPEPEPESQPAPEPEPVEVLLPVAEDENAALVILEQDQPEIVVDEDGADEEPAPVEEPEPEPAPAQELEVREVDVLAPEERAKHVSSRGLIREVRVFDRAKPRR